MSAVPAAEAEAVGPSRAERLLRNRSATYAPARGEPFHEAWVVHAGQPETVRLAHAIVAQWLGSRMIIEPDELIVGRLGLESIVRWSSDRGLQFDEARWQAARQGADGPAARYLDDLAATWRGRATRALLDAILTPTERAVMGGRTSSLGGCHSAPLHVRLAEEGTAGLRRRVAASRAEHLGMPGTEPAEWYDVLNVILDGLDGVALAYADVARRAAGAAEGRRRAELLDIAARLERVIRGPAQSFPDALQAYWLSMVLHEPNRIDSACRFDQDLWPFLQRDLESGHLSEQEAREWVEAIWYKLAANRSWSMTLSGQLPEGGDVTNPLSWLLLETLACLRTDAPNVELRVHRGTPPALLRRACELLASGLSMPALVNDEPVIAAMRARGIPEEHARDYTLVGCTQVVPRGRCGGAYEDLIVTATKPLELALHDGIDPMTGQRMGPATGSPEELDTYERLEAAVLAQIDHMVRTTTEVVNREYAVLAQHTPDLVKSLLIEGCLERGRDYRRGGPLYTEGLADVLGISNLADSLLVLRRLVYEEGRLTLPEMVRALDADWEGQEALRLACRNAVSKFGNDDAAADALTVRLFTRINEAFQARERIYGRRFGIDVVGWTGAVEWGRRAGATPDGRKRGSPLADSVGASQGLDRQGVTALIRSVAKLPHDQSHGILALNLRFSGRTFAGPEGVDKMLMLVDAAFAQGLQQLQVNVVDADTLRAAQARPEDFESLMVRIGGFSTYFNWLSRDHQDDIISRTEHSL